jgi:RecB family endonuclease NucS
MQCALKQQPGLIEPRLTIIDHELPTGVGSIDLYARDAQNRLVVIELKRGKATHEAVHQLARYVEQGKANQLPDTRVWGLLVASDATGPALKQLAALSLEFKRLTAF